MTRAVFVVWLVAMACSSSQGLELGTSAVPEPTGPPVLGPPHQPWDTLTPAQQQRFMTKVVLPKFKAMFQDFDAQKFATVKCVTCHGPGVDNGTFKLPNPKLYILPESKEDFEKLAATKRNWMDFMKLVEDLMATTMGMRQNGSDDPGWHACYTCHTHRPGGQDL
jgi:cytochrome c553